MHIHAYCRICTFGFLLNGKCFRIFGIIFTHEFFSPVYNFIEIETSERSIKISYPIKLLSKRILFKIWKNSHIQIYVTNKATLRIVMATPTWIKHQAPPMAPNESINVYEHRTIEQCGSNFNLYVRTCVVSYKEGGKITKPLIKNETEKGQPKSKNKNNE